MSERHPGIVIRLSDELGTWLDDHDELRAPDQVPGDPDDSAFQQLQDLAELLTAFGARTARFVPREAGSPAALRGLERRADRSWRARLMEQENSQEEIDELAQRRSRRVGSSTTQYWYIFPEHADDTESLLIDLSNHTIVEWAMRMPKLSDAALAPADQYFADQGYLEPGPKGIGAEAAWGAGFCGWGMRLVDVERGWMFDHQDLPTSPSDQPIHGFNYKIKDHGTSVLGVIAGRLGPERPAPAPPLGIVGIAHDITSVLTSSRATQQGSYDVAGAIAAAILHDPLPHVLLLEVQLEFTMAAAVDDATEVTRRYPLELLPPLWFLIWVATQIGVVVIEPAGNGARSGLYGAKPEYLGGLDLDAAGNSDLLADFVAAGTKWNAAGLPIMELNPTAPTFFDSGAVMVGAANSETETDGGVTGHRASEEAVAANNDQRRAWGSNYGARVNCYAWGDSVVTTDASGPQGYTWDFSRTSAASAIVAGAALLTQQMFIHRHKAPASPSTVRKFLEDPNASTPHVGERPIGRMPDLEGILHLV